MYIENPILRKFTRGYKIVKSQDLINHLIYIDIKIFAESEKRTRILDTNDNNIQARYKNGIWPLKCAMIIMK